MSSSDSTSDGPLAEERSSASAALAWPLCESAYCSGLAPSASSAVGSAPACVRVRVRVRVRVTFDDVLSLTKAIRVRVRVRVRVTQQAGLERRLGLGLGSELS